MRQPTKDDVHAVAVRLMQQHGTTTTLDVKNDLRSQGFYAEQANIARFMAQLSREQRWTWESAGKHRIYSHSPRKRLTPDAARDRCYTQIVASIDKSVIETGFKEVAKCDLDQALASYDAQAYKSCIVMLGAVLEGVMLGVLRTDLCFDLLTALPEPPKLMKKIGGMPRTKAELKDKLPSLSFEDFKQLITLLKPEVVKLKVEGIQTFRNAVHPWKSIQDPTTYRDPDQTRAMHHLTAIALLSQAILA